ncbi:MAG: 3-ketoacyl-ACP reductase [Flavipsychrobacter sp.]|jgi:3-oxoacyl-[acyl-carrier protein] reductase|nr:3-ketoacyl-ACP reductase [Flavipsychrobacter sp.]
MQSLTNKTALVTGAGKGIGKAIAMALAAEGVHLGLLARTEKDVKELAAAIEANGGKAAFATADVSNRQAVEEAVADLKSKLGSFDILINNAGTGTFGSFLELDPETWEQQVKVNLFGVYYVTRAVLPDMIAAKAGDIINISSTAGKSGSALTSAYSASKFGVFGLSESLMQEVRKLNIRVTALAPSTIVTDLAQSANLIKGDPERVMHPEDIAELVIAQLKLHPRLLLKEASIFSTNPG